MDRMVDFIAARAATLEADFSVNPWILIALFVVCGPFFYYSAFRLARAALTKREGSLSTWSTIFLASAALPYLYVLLFGRNMPWWIYLIVGGLIIQGVVSLVRKLRRRLPAERKNLQVEHEPPEN